MGVPYTRSAAGRDAEMDSLSASCLLNAQRLVEWSTAKSTLFADRLIVLAYWRGLHRYWGRFLPSDERVIAWRGPARLLGGIVFRRLRRLCVGAEPTGNCMLYGMGLLATHAIDVGRNLLIAYAANAAGALAFAMLIAGSGLLQSGYGRTAAAIAEAKMNLSFEQAFVRGLLCNALVCVAVWMITAARTIPSKLVGLIFPISAFITLGFEHAIANLYLVPSGLLAGAAGSFGAAVTNLVAVTLGNLVGGLVIALAFWMAYLRRTDSKPALSARFWLAAPPCR